MNIRFFTSLVFALTGQASAGSFFEAYFHNDSVNGFQLSDAYETHNMGLIYSNDNHYLNLDFAIVSPDMWVYRNRFREANRSFGELISLEVGKEIVSPLKYATYLKLRSSGEFGLDKAQDFMHRVFSLQPVNEVNDLVRMPSSFWWGLGVQTEFVLDQQLTQNLTFDLNFYAGTDRASVRTKLRQRYSKSRLNYNFGVGLELVAYDNVISSAPIFADERNIIPSFEFGASYDFKSYSIYINETFSLPTISSDDDLFVVFSAGLRYQF